MPIRPDEQFAIVPRWLVEKEISDRALRLYATLACHADYDSGQCNPGRKRLATTLRCSVDSVDRAKTELVKTGALSVKHEADAPNTYTLHRLPPGGRTHAARPQDSGVRGRTAAAQTRTTERESSSSRTWPPKTLEGKNLTEDEVLLAGEVLATFNDVFEKKFSSPEFLRLIVLRAREHPEMTVGDFRVVVEKASRNRWWETKGRGDFTPKVIFGNGVIFDRTMNRDESAGDDEEDLSIYDR